jgi:hypothetical protein
MQNGQFRAPPREKTIQDYPQLKLTAPKEGAMERKPSFMMYVHANVSTPSNSDVRMVVFTQTPDQDPKKQKIEIKCGLMDGLTVLKAIQKVANDPAEKVEPMVAQSFRPKDFKNRAAGNIEDCKVVVGKNEQGVFISLVHWNSEVPRKRFYFGFDEMFEFVVNAEKNQTFSMFSALRALAHTETLADYMREEMKRVWKPWAPSNNGNGGGSGFNNNYNNGGGNRNNYNNNNYNDSSNHQADLDDVFG